MTLRKTIVMDRRRIVQIGFLLPAVRIEGGMTRLLPNIAIKTIATPWTQVPLQAPGRSLAQVSRSRRKDI